MHRPFRPVQNCRLEMDSMIVKQPPMEPADPGKLNASCLILAGGEGKRLTPDKPLLDIEGEPIVGRVARVVTSVFEQVVLVTNTPEKYRFLGLPHARDERPGCGPLMGIYSGLKKIRHDVAFVCGADMPFLREDLLRAEFDAITDEFDIVVPYPRGLPEFLHGYYRKRCLKVMGSNLDAGLFKIEMLRDRCRIRRLERAWFSARGLDEVLETAFVNINTLQEYQHWSGADSRRKAAAE